MAIQLVRPYVVTFSSFYLGEVMMILVILMGRLDLVHFINLFVLIKISSMMQKYRKE